MKSGSNEQGESNQPPLPASAGIAFAIGCLSLFYGLIAVVDPLL